MKNGIPQRRSRFSPFILAGTFILAAAAVVVPVYSVHSSSLSAGDKQAGVTSGIKTSHIGSVTTLNPAIRASGLFLPIPVDSPETIETFAAPGCTTPRTTFFLGETVCVVVNFVTESNRFVNWLSPPDSTVAFSSPTIPDNLTHSYLYTPTVAGTWKATIASPTDSSIIPTVFEVVAPGPIVTYAAGCVNPQVTFNLGNSVCVRVTGGTVAPRRISWIDPSGSIRQITPITTDPYDDTFSVPGDPTTTLSNGVEVTNVGTWRVSIISSRGILVAFTTFFVKDPGNATADVSVSKSSLLPSGQISAGSTNTYPVVVYNSGPDTAQPVVVTDVVPANMTFVSITPSVGCVTPGPGGTGTITCTIPTLGRGASVTFEISLEVMPATPGGTQLSNTATVVSPTNDPILDNNSSTASLIVSDTGTVGCTLNCPADMTVQTNTTQAGQPGAFVAFSAASGIGDCGAISNNPSSKDPLTDLDTFFAVGTHLITSSSGSGDTCTFTVTVVDTPPPTISCQANQTVTAAPSATSASVAVVNPTTNPSSGVTLVGIRSDDPNCTDVELDPGCTPIPVTDPYPLGTTTIVWTVIMPNGQRASCTQRITVLENNCGNDTINPTITAPPPVTVGTGPDNGSCTVALDDELGSICTADCEPGEPTAADNCTVSVSVTGIPLNNAFPIGTTVVTYTATDGSGNHASATQNVTVFDNTPPIIVAPPAASYTCLSEVPAGAAAIALARGDNPNLLNGGPPTDNCGTPVITYSDTSTGAGSAASPRIITRTYTATDTSPLHNSSSSVQIITVIDPTPPTFTFVPPAVTAYTGPGATTCDTVVSNATLGTATATDNCAGVTVTRSPSGNTFPVGPPTTITWTATDWAGNTATATQTVTVIDNTPPVITLNGQTPSMWPPNHKYQTFGVTGFVTGASDNCGSVSIGNVVIEKVTSDEIENGNGDGNTLNDIVIAADCKSVQLRSEREGSSNGRVYTIFFKVTDAWGNVGTATAKVVVRHNPGETAVDSGVHYTVTCGGP